jgi:membrane associated rhomboid family serine protease
MSCPVRPYVAILIFLVIVGGIAYRVSTPDDRKRFMALALVYADRAKHLEQINRTACAPFFDALRTRTRSALATPTLIALNVLVFLGLLFGSGKMSDPATLMSWGASFGPRTTNGEWWRLGAMMFVQPSMMQLLVGMLGLLQVGLIAERLVGGVAFSMVYVAAGIFAGLVGLSTHAIAIQYGATGAILGVYGLLLATTVWGHVRGSPLKMPRPVAVRIAPAALWFLLYTLIADDIDMTAALTGLAVGLAYGLVWGRRGAEEKTPIYRVAVAACATAAIAALFSVPLRGVADVRPEIARIIAMESRLTALYDTAAHKFKTGRIQAEALIDLIDRTIMPELKAEDLRVKALEGVPREHQPLVAAAEEYLRLRDESWRLRAEGLHKANMKTLQQAEQAERASLEALARLALPEPEKTQ